MKKFLLTVVASAFVLITAEFAFTYSGSAPPAGHTNAPGESNCTACHTSFPLTTSGVIWNNINLTSTVPLSQFSPGTTYTLQLSFSNPSSVKYGFELVALPSGAGPGDPSIGTMTATSPQTALQLSGGREYISHSSTGTSAPSNSKTWSFDWETPSGYTGNVDFYVVINSTNNNFLNSGDMIYAKVFSSTVLPVKWLSYEVKNEKAGNHILWSTASEHNNNRFEIEKSSDNKDWQLIGTVKAKGNSSRPVHYNYLDASGSAVKSFYRIRQVDTDGKYEYSKVLIAQSLQGADESVSYDPLTGKISISSPALMAPAILFNLSGLPVSQDLYGESLDASHLEKGIYLLKLPSGNYQKIYIY